MRYSGSFVPFITSLQHSWADAYGIHGSLVVAQSGTVRFATETFPPQRHSYKQAFIKRPKFNFQLIEVARISDGIALLKALGEGSLMAGTRKRPHESGYYSMAECVVRTS